MRTMSVHHDRLDARVAADGAHARAHASECSAWRTCAIYDNRVVHDIEHSIGLRVAVGGLNVVVYRCVAEEGAFLRNELPLGWKVIRILLCNFPPLNAPS